MLYLLYAALCAATWITDYAMCQMEDRLVFLQGVLSKSVGVVPAYCADDALVRGSIEKKGLPGL